MVSSPSPTPPQPAPQRCHKFGNYGAWTPALSSNGKPKPCPLDRYEHFYAELEPFVHFIPVKEDVSDVLEQVSHHSPCTQNLSLNVQPVIFSACASCTHWHVVFLEAPILKFATRVSHTSCHPTTLMTDS